MPKSPLSREQKQAIQGLYAQDVPLREIAQRVKTSYGTVYYQTRLKEKIDPNTGQPFATGNEYQLHLLRKRINPETNKPFQTRTEYSDYAARQRINPHTGLPFETKREYENYLTQQRTNQETGKPFQSEYEYERSQAEQRAARSENKRLSDLIRERLNELGKNGSWLAHQMGVSRQIVSQYCHGRAIPSQPLLEKLFGALQVPYHTIDDLVAEKSEKEREE